MAITSKETRETLERWQFDLNLEETTAGGKENQSRLVQFIPCYSFRAFPAHTLIHRYITSDNGSSSTKVEKPPKSTAQIQKDIQDIIRQITSSVTFLPSMEEKCAPPLSFPASLRAIR